MEFLTLLGGGIPYGHKGVAFDHWRLSGGQSKDGRDGADDNEGEAGQKGQGHNVSGQKEERQQIRSLKFDL